MLNVAQLPRDKCPLCSKEAATDVDATLLSHGHKSTPIIIKCVRCGEFSITWEALEELDRRGKKVIISGIAREWTELERPLEITKENLLSLINLAPKTLKEKKRKFLQAILRKYPRLGQECYLDAHNDYYLAYVSSTFEYGFLRNSILADGLITSPRMENKREVFVLTAEGWEVAESIEKPAALREKAFVAMWFNDLVNPAFHEGIAPAIEETGYRPIRDDLEEHADSVIDRIIAEIKEARFIVADFTGNRGGVYFEAGFARGLGLNVIWTCKKEHFKDVHFDVQGFNVIAWKTPGELKERLSARIRAIVGYGPLHDPTNSMRDF